MEREQWDERYRVDELIWKAEPNRFLVEEAAGLAPGRALDLACGEGRNALWLAERGWQVTAVDFSSVGLEKARRLASERGLELVLVEADVLEWEPPAASFDLVIVMYLHLPAGARRRVQERAASALAPGATLLVVGHDSTNLTEGIGGPRTRRYFSARKTSSVTLTGWISSAPSAPAGRWPPMPARSTPSTPSFAPSGRHRPLVPRRQRHIPYLAWRTA